MEKENFLLFIPLTLTLSLGRGNRKYFCVSPDSIYTATKHAPTGQRIGDITYSSCGLPDALFLGY
jgi:hypothetical protein